MTDNNSSFPALPEKNRMSLPKQNGKIRYCFLTILGLIAFGGLLYFGGFESFEKIKHPNYIWLLAAFCGSGFMIFIFAIRWGGIVNSLLGRKITDNMTYFFYSLSSLAVGTVLPHTAGSLVGKAAALNKFQKISMKNSAASVLLDKVFDGFFMLMFGWPLLLLLSGVATIKQVIVISIAEFLIISLLVLVHYSLWLRLLKITIASLVNFLGMFSFIRKRKQWQKIDALNRLDEWDVLQKETILRAYFLTAIGQLMLTVRAWLAAMAVGVGITPFEIFVGIGLVQASILISVTPGALGFADAAWFIALVGAGIPKEIIPVFLVSIRVIENLAVLFFWLPLYFFIIWKSAVRRRNK